MGQTRKHARRAILPMAHPDYGEKRTPGLTMTLIPMVFF
jgi:hypothetical protein